MKEYIIFGFMIAIAITAISLGICMAVGIGNLLLPLCGVCVAFVGLVVGYFGDQRLQKKNKSK